MQTKFYNFLQRATGDKYLINPILGIGYLTIIEAASKDNAITRAKKLGMHETCDGECQKCGARWKFMETTEQKIVTANCYDFIERLYYPMVYLHMKSGVFVELNSKHQFSNESATELLQLNEQRKLNLRGNEIAHLKSFIHTSNKNPVLKNLDPLREPPSMVPSKFNQHETLCRALELKIITDDVYKVLQKTTMTKLEIESFKKKIKDSEPRKKRGIDWAKMRMELEQARAEIPTPPNNSTSNPLDHWTSTPVSFNA